MSGNQSCSSTGIESELLAKLNVVKHPDGFVETSYRLLYHYSDRHWNKVDDPDAKKGPNLCVVLSSGTVENEKICYPEAVGAVVAYPWSQDATEEMREALKARESQGKKWPKAPYGDLIDPFVFKRKNGSWALVQTWANDFNDKYKATRELWSMKDPSQNPNPLPPNFEEGAVQDFLLAMTRMFYDKDATTVNPEIREHAWYSGMETNKPTPVYLGDGESLTRLLTESATIRKELDIISVDESTYSFVARQTFPSAPEKPSKEKPFKMDPCMRYALYISMGYVNVGCVKPLDQFRKEAYIKNGTLEPHDLQSGAGSGQAQPLLQSGPRSGQSCWFSVRTAMHNLFRSPRQSRGPASFRGPRQSRAPSFPQ